MSILVLIPARMAATRLPGKPLADIAGRPMIAHVADRAAASGVGRVVIATDSAEIRDAAQSFGHEATMTASHHQSGSDRIFEALETLDPGRRVEAVLNLQGDLPTIEPALIGRAALERFVSLPPSALEKREKLEQLRALEAGMRIDAAIVDTVPLGVDTPDDLERARALISGELQGTGEGR